MQGKIPILDGGGIEVGLDKIKRGEFTMCVVGEEKALSPKCKAGSEVLQGGGDGKSIKNLEGGKA